MTTLYDKGQVPILDFTNPAGALFHNDVNYSYPMGNTRKRSITEQIGTAKDQHLDLLLIGCGDVRNLLCTVSELYQRKSQQRPKSIDFHLNDYDVLILPRNSILLEIASSIDPDSTDDVDFLWNVWNNIGLSDLHIQRLRQVIQSLVERKFEDEGCMLQFQDSKTEQECRAVWKDWLDLDLDVYKMKEERRKFNEKQLSSNEDISGHILKKLALAICSRNVDYLRESNSLHEEVRHWSFQASTTDDIDHVNPTLIRPFLHNWCINYNASPFEGYMPFAIPDIERCKSLTALCKETLALWVKHFQQFKQLHPVKVFMWIGDGLGRCTNGLPSDLLFDVIDTSNISDHGGLLNVLVCCVPRLKRPRESLLLTSSMLCWGAGCKDMEDYYNRCIGIDTKMLPTILGVQLAVDLDLGDRKVPDEWEEILYWVKASTTRTKLTIDKESDVITALWNLTKRCFNLIEDPETPKHCLCGSTLSSPLTLLRIIYQMHPLIEGGASRIMDLLESELRYDFYQEHGFSWKLIKSIAMQDNEPVVQVTVPGNLEYDDKDRIFSRITPMIVFLNSPFEHFIGGSFDCCPILYNCIRFNVQEGKVTFHMLKKDWKNARKTWLSVIYDKDQAVFKQRPINLKKSSLIDVRRVDPVQTFGLFAVQKFDVCDSSSSLLQVIKVQEEDDSYHAEFDILDTVKCNAKDMKVEFEPESSPTLIRLNFQDETGCTLHFSCPVSASSKFQISKKNAKLVCKINKKEHYVTGEMALINPAQVPFHAMTMWDPKEDDLEWTFHKMFRNDAAAGTEVGPPFRETRRCILSIFRDRLKTQIPTLWEIKTDIADPSKILFIKTFNETYKWNNFPYAKCIFLFQKFGHDFHENVLGLAPFAPEFLGCETRTIILKEEEFHMLGRILYINAARTEQDTKRTKGWTDSFLSPVCARETNLNKSPETFLDVMMTNVFWHDLIGTGKPDGKHRPESEVPDKRSDSCGFCQKPSANLEECPRCKKVSICNGVCQKQHWEQEHKDSSGTSFSEWLRNEVVKNDDHFLGEDSDVVARCVFCHKSSKDLKKCTRCWEVSYCNSVCQRKHWEKEHKLNCVASSSKKDQSKSAQDAVVESLEKDPKEIDCCTFCHQPSTDLKQCKRCKTVSYCSKTCQTQHWVKEHKVVCKSWSMGQKPTSPLSECSSSSSNFCESCRKAWADLKNCPTCKTVAYSDKACQTSLW